MITLLFQVTLCWGAFALLYAVLLRHETFFRANRVYLLATIVLGLALPFVGPWLTGMTDMTGLPVVTLPVVKVGADRGGAGSTGVQWLWWAYGIGVAASAGRMLWGLFRIAGIAKRGQAERLPDGTLLIRTERTALPFSFFRWIFVPLDFEPGGPDSAAMLAHERAHAHGGHSFDVLLAELLCVVFWFHPLAHWYRRALRTVHEYLADAEAARQTQKKQYGLLLLRQSHPGMSVAFAHHFFQSPLKQRLIMLTKNASPRLRGLKYGLLVPMFALLVLVLNHPPAAAQGKEPAIQLSEVETIPAFPGGEQAMMKFLGKNISYPAAARESKAQGMVVLEFVVEKNGSISEITHLNTQARLHPDIVAEAIRVVSTMPRWTPGVKEGQPVRVKFTLPIKFKLE